MVNEELMLECTHTIHDEFVEELKEQGIISRNAIAFEINKNMKLLAKRAAELYRIREDHSSATMPALSLPIEK